MTSLRFDDRVAVITGAGRPAPGDVRGLGEAYALLLASRGAKVVVNDPGVRPDGNNPNASAAERVVREIKEHGGEAVASTHSVATPDGGQAIIQTALDHYGRIDILIHNAGNVRRSLVKDMSYEDFEAVLDVHLRGAFHVVRPAMPLMCKAGYGRIVLTSSIGGLYGNHQVANYCTSKAGLIGLAHAIALEGAAEGVKCNVIVPAAKTRLAAGRDTSMFPPTMAPECVAPAVAWLAHETCSITGEMLISIAGRIAKAVIAETPGVFRPAWTIEQVAEQMSVIRNTDTLKLFAAVPSGHIDHIQYSFEMAWKALQR
jgi:NAD(P)-dependent dehydrogenase (short-subunit alcohol dehydrogenase family)